MSIDGDDKEMDIVAALVQLVNQLSDDFSVVVLAGVVKAHRVNH